MLENKTWLPPPSPGTIPTRKIPPYISLPCFVDLPCMFHAKETNLAKADLLVALPQSASEVKLACANKLGAFRKDTPRCTCQCGWLCLDYCKTIR